MATNPIFDDVPAWPEQRSQAAPPPAGHNRPPLDELIPQEFREALLADKPEFLKKLDALVDAAERAKADDDETLGRCGDLVKSYRAIIAHVEATHKAVKAPYLEGGRLVDAERKAMLAPVEAAKAKVEAIGNAYVAKREAEAKAERARIEAEQRAAAEAAARAERERIEAEQAAARAAADAESEEEREAAASAAAEAARRAEEAQRAAALAPAAPAERTLIHSDAGATVGGKQEWLCEVEDYTKAMRHVRSDPKVKEAIDAAIKRLVRAGQRELTGVRIWPVAKANFR
jgi:hypothetical protein